MCVWLSYHPCILVLAFLCLLEYKTKELLTADEQQCSSLALCVRRRNFAIFDSLFDGLGSSVKKRKNTHFVILYSRPTHSRRKTKSPFSHFSIIELSRSSLVTGAHHGENKGFLFITEDTMPVLKCYPSSFTSSLSLHLPTLQGQLHPFNNLLVPV